MKCYRAESRAHTPPTMKKTLIFSFLPPVPYPSLQSFSKERNFSNTLFEIDLQTFFYFLITHSLKGLLILCVPVCVCFGVGGAVSERKPRE